MSDDLPLKIAFLDRDTTDRDDLDFSALEKFGEITYYTTTATEQVAARIADVDIIITNKVNIDRSAMEAAAPRLKLIQVAATGVNNVDLVAARELGIKVYNVSGYSTPAVAQHVFALLLNLVTNVNRYGSEPEEWTESSIFTRLDYPVFELAGKRMGIVGYGDIGRAVGKIADSFGMEVVALSRQNSPGSSIVRLELDEFLASCDVISLHCPLTEDNYQFINSETLGKMKSSAILINTGRGDLIHEADLLEALKKGEIGGAGIDVISVEPPPKDHLMMSSAARELENLIITPHTAWSSVESRQRLVDGIAGNFAAAFLENAGECSGENRVA